MKRKVLAGAMGVTLLGMATVVWSFSDAKATTRSATVGWEVPDLKTLSFQRQALEEQHMRVKNRAEAKRRLVLSFLAGQLETEVMLCDLEEWNRSSRGALAMLAEHFPNATERDIAVWHAVGLVEGEMEAARADLDTRLQAEAWLMEHGLVPCLAW